MAHEVGGPRLSSQLWSPDMGTRLTNDEFQSRVKRRLGIEICEERPCPYCFQIMDKFGAHAESCMGGGDKTVMHNQSSSETTYTSKLTRPTQGLSQKLPVSWVQTVVSGGQQTYCCGAAQE